MRISDLSSDVCSTDLNLHAPRAEIAAAKIETETTDAEQRQVERQAVCLKLAGQIHPADVVEIGEAATAQTLGARLDVEQLRSEERRVGKEGVSKWRSRGSTVR